MSSSASLDVISALQSRRACKHFDAAHRLEESEIRHLFEAILQTPTAFNLQHWRFVLVRDPAIRQRIRAVAWDQAQVTDASLLVVLTGDLQAWKKYPKEVWREAPPAVQDFLVPAIGQYYEGREQVQRDEVMRSCGLAGMALMLAAESMGYQSCPMDGFDFEAVAEIIGLPADHCISFMVAIGKSTQPPWPKPGQLPYEEVVLTDRFLV
jgi:nitroreductase